MEGEGREGERDRTGSTGCMGKEGHLADIGCLLLVTGRDGTIKKRSI